MEKTSLLISVSSCILPDGEEDHELEVQAKFSGLSLNYKATFEDIRRMINEFKRPRSKQKKTEVRSC